MAEHNDLGKRGEQFVVDYLLQEGYTIMERNWRMNHLEIDIVASRGDDLVFVEVKTRQSAAVDPLKAITPRKVQLLCRAAEGYIRQHRLRLSPRFDVAALTAEGTSFRMEYIRNAIRPQVRGY